MGIVDTIFSYLPAKRKQTPSGWTKFNAVCCPHRGSTPDTRGRGGIIRNAEGCSYHCFNCGYKASYIAGRHLTHKMRQLLSWFGAPDDVITKLSFEALKIESDQTELAAVTIPHFDDKPLPSDAIKLTVDTELEEWMFPAIEYIYSRDMTLDTYDFYVSPKELKDRVIIPYKFENRIVGYTARKVTDGKPKYLSDQTPGYVFNMDAQLQDSEIVIVVEGAMDALSVNGIALLGAEIMEKQALLINRLQKKVIVVPDRDKDGARTVNEAIELGWAVSMPDWDADIKDTNDAMRRYGKLYTLFSIINSAESYELKIRLKAKTWFNL